MNEEKNKIEYSRYDSQTVTEALDYVLDTRDEFLFATMLKGCKWGFDRGEDSHIENTKGALNLKWNGLLQDPQYTIEENGNNHKGAGDKNRNKFLQKVTWQAVLCLILWYWSVRFYCTYTEISIFEAQFRGLILFEAVVFLAVIAIVYFSKLKKHSQPVFDGKNRDMLIWHRKESGIKGGLRRLLNRIGRKSTWHAILCIVPLWLLIIGFKMGVWAFESWRVFVYLVKNIFHNFLYSLPALISCFVFYKSFFGNYRFSIQDITGQDMVLWEDRADHKRHVWTKPLFFGCFTRAKMFDNMQKKNAGVKHISGRLLELACDLSVSRYFSLLSEEIRKFTEEYREGDMEIEITAGEGCNDIDGGGEYTIRITGEKGMDPDSIVPTESEKNTRSFTLPYKIGKKVVQDFRRYGVLHLNDMDDQVRKTGEYFRFHKSEMKKNLRSYGTKETAEIFRRLDRTDIFTDTE